MTVIRHVVFLVVLTFLWTPSSADTEVSCVVMETCILPGSFQEGPEVVIHWTNLTTGLGVHSYYYNQDQLGDQQQMFRNRTSLFKDQISRGNASLQLTEVKVQDEGRYRCYTSTTKENKDSFINLKVYAPIRKVDIQLEGNRITCSSEGIYPEPELTWSTTPPSNINLHNTTTVQQNEQQLYSISSSLILSDNHTDLIYSCTVKTRRNRWTTALRHQTMNSSEATIPCMTSNSDLRGFSLVWRFNHNQTILNQNRTDIPDNITAEWKKYVKDVSESGDITLQDLSSEQEGIYTCQLSNAEETYITNTILRKENYQDDRQTGSGVSAGAIAAVVVVPILILVLLGLVGSCRYKKKKGKKTGSGGNNNQVSMAPLRDGGGQEDEDEPHPPGSPLRRRN